MINNISFGSTYRVNLADNSWGKLDRFQCIQQDLSSSKVNVDSYCSWRDDNIHQTIVIDDKLDTLIETFLKSKHIIFSKFTKENLSDLKNIPNRMVVPNYKYPTPRYLDYPVKIDTDKFDKVFQKSDIYLDKNDVKHNPERYEAFERYIQSAEPIDAPEVYIRESNNAPVIDFQDGTHRYAYLRNKGMKNIPVAMDKESLKVAVKYNLL